MAQDFAKQRNNPDGNKRKRAASKPAAGGNANWSWFFSGLMSGVIISIAAYLGVLKLGEGVAETAQSAQTGANPEDLPTFSFGFYNELANAEVAVNIPAGTVVPGLEPMPGTNPTAAATNSESTTSAPDPATNPVTTPATSQELATANEQRPALYLLQAGSFQNREDAESRRARIILLNMNANVAQAVVAGRTRYRVQVGPFPGRQNAENARDILSGNDIDSIPSLVP